ncbi:MAG: FeoA domain-containing protein [Desulfobacteraceae bacterium]
MHYTHDNEIKQFKRLFKQQGIKDFERKYKILEIFLLLEEHVTVMDIVNALRKNNVSEDRLFVEQTMELLCDFGFAHKLTFEDNLVHYEHRHIGLHHDHMVCTKCGGITEFRDENLEKQQLKLAGAYKFHMLQHKMTIYGICSGCLEKRSFVIPLDRANPGEIVKIIEVEGGKKINMRLSAMGIKIGEHLEIVSARAGAQAVVAVADSRFIIGKGMANKVMVQPVQSENAAALTDPSRPRLPVKMTLRDMKEGQEGIISKVSGETVLKRRLLELGINRGTKVFVEKYAPLKDPVEIIVKGYHISLRVEEAACITVENVRTSVER